MHQEQLQALHRWFDGYVATFNDIPQPDHQNITLKIEHTKKVCTLMDQLTRGEGMATADCRIAAAVALLHDVGRFPQYRRWRTFRDAVSDNHARLAIEVIREHALLADLEPVERLTVEEAVRFHNLLGLPLRYRSRGDRFIRLIRDADKLDIWRVFVEHFQKPVAERPSAVTLGFPDTPGVSACCVEQLLGHQVVQLKHVASVNDFILLLLSWVFDLNFASSYALLQQSGHGEQLGALLPDSPELDMVREAVRNYVERQLFAR